MPENEVFPEWPLPFRIGFIMITVGFLISLIIGVVTRTSMQIAYGIGFGSTFLISAIVALLCLTRNYKRG